MINLDEFESKRNHWIALYVIAENETYFNRFGVEHIRKKIRKSTENKNFTTNVYIIQAYDSIMCRYFWLDLLISC